ncbi:hypothetical protein [Thiobacillus sp.]
MNLKLPMIFAVATLAGPFALTAAAETTTSKTAAGVTYNAQLSPMNSSVTGSKTIGVARFTVNGDDLDISITVRGAPPNTIHWQHFHGFKDGRMATCVTQAADKNGDGIVDLIETGLASGTTMVPFDTAPAAMDIAHGTYPEASADGSYTYHQVVSLKDLSAAFAKAHPGQALDLDKRVVYIHGVPGDTALPPTVASLGPIPAQVTLPIACGKIERLDD